MAGTPKKKALTPEQIAALDAAEAASAPPVSAAPKALTPEQIKALDTAEAKAAAPPVSPPLRRRNADVDPKTGVITKHIPKPDLPDAGLLDAIGRNLADGLTWPANLIGLNSSKLSAGLQTKVYPAIDSALNIFSATPAGPAGLDAEAELSAGGPSPYERVARDEQAKFDASNVYHPVASPIAGFTGGMALPLPKAAKVIGEVAAPVVSTIERVGRPMLKGAAQGIGGSILNLFGRSEDPNPLTRALDATQETLADPAAAMALGAASTGVANVAAGKLRRAGVAAHERLRMDPDYADATNAGAYPSDGKMRGTPQMEANRTKFGPEQSAKASDAAARNLGSILDVEARRTSNIGDPIATKIAKDANDLNLRNETESQNIASEALAAAQHRDTVEYKALQKEAGDELAKQAHVTILGDELHNAMSAIARKHIADITPEMEARALASQKRVEGTFADQLNPLNPSLVAEAKLPLDTAGTMLSRLEATVLREKPEQVPGVNAGAAHEQAAANLIDRHNAVGDAPEAAAFRHTRWTLPQFAQVISNLDEKAFQEDKLGQTESANAHRALSAAAHKQLEAIAPVYAAKRKAVSTLLEEVRQEREVLGVPPGTTADPGSSAQREATRNRLAGLSDPQDFGVLERLSPKAAPVATLPLPINSMNQPPAQLNRSLAGRLVAHQDATKRQAAYEAITGLKGVKGSSDFDLESGTAKKLVRDQLHTPVKDRNVDSGFNKVVADLAKSDPSIDIAGVQAELDKTRNLLQSAGADPSSRALDLGGGSPDIAKIGKALNDSPSVKRLVELIESRKDGKAAGAMLKELLGEQAFQRLKEREVQEGKAVGGDVATTAVGGTWARYGLIRRLFSVHDMHLAGNKDIKVGNHPKAAMAAGRLAAQDNRKLPQNINTVRSP